MYQSISQLMVCLLVPLMALQSFWKKPEKGGDWIKTMWQRFCDATRNIFMLFYLEQLG